MSISKKLIVCPGLADSSDYDHATGVLYTDIRAFIHLKFVLVKFEFFPCGCNNIAHALAALGASQAESRHFWQVMSLSLLHNGSRRSIKKEASLSQLCYGRKKKEK